MTETIESFVAKLKTEGLEAGQKQAQQLRDDAKQQAQQTISQANEQAEKIIADAKVKADNILARSRTELELAARDAALKLRESLERALKASLAAPVSEPLSDVEFLRPILQDIVIRYVEANISGCNELRINLTPQVHEKLADWAIQQLHNSVKDKDLKRLINLHGILKQAGFECNFTGATIEITQESVVETLMGLVGGNLRDIFDKALSRKE
jgi:hypothetical protein